jgi:hypothetical protein
MSKAGERILRSIAEARSYARGEPIEGTIVHSPALGEASQGHHGTGARIDPAIKAHADLSRAAQRHGGSVKPVDYAGVDWGRYQGRGLADVSLFTNISELAVSLPTAAVAALFLKEARQTVVAWLDARKNRCIKIKTKEMTVIIRGSDDVERAMKMVCSYTEKDVPKNLTRNKV